MTRTPLAARAAAGSLAVLALLGLATGCTAADRSPTSSSSASAARNLLPDAIRTKGAIDVATFYNYPPFTQVTDGKLSGIEPELLRAVADRLGVQARFHDLKFEAMIPSVVNGRNDMMIGMLADTEKRREQVDFLDLARSDIVAMVAKGNPQKVDPKNLCGTSVGESAGSYQESVVKAISTQCEAEGRAAVQLLSFPDPATNFLSLLNGRIATTLQDPAIAQDSATKNPGLVVLKDPVPMSDVQREGWIFAKNSALAPVLAAAIVELHKDGTWDRLMKKYGMADSAILPPTINTTPAPTPTP